jgi:hypothetical protein
MTPAKCDRLQKSRTGIPNPGDGSAGRPPGCYAYTKDYFLKFHCDKMTRGGRRAAPITTTIHLSRETICGNAISL